jgi:DNA-binding CsgD family transcriptional regulator
MTIQPNGIYVLEVYRFGISHGLSQRERQILLLLARGAHPKSIGDAIGCGYASVRTHLRRMYAKLGCSGARELMIRFFSEMMAHG